MDKEINALEKNKTWNMVYLPKGRKPIGSKWVFKVTYKANGDLETYKARQVANRYYQNLEQIMMKPFHQWSKMTTFRCLVAITANRGWMLNQLDVKNAFLHGDIQEDVYMIPPPGQ